MKKSLILVAGLFATIGLQATESKVCYKAINPKVITIVASELDRTEKALSAVLTLKTESEYQTEQAILDVKSKTMKFNTVAIHDKGDIRGRYAVDCDGGSTIFKKAKDGTLVASTDYLAGEVVTAEEGCSTGNIKFKDLKLKKVACSK